MIVLLYLLVVIIATMATMIPATNESIAYNLPFPIVRYTVTFVAYSIFMVVILIIYHAKKDKKS